MVVYPLVVWSQLKELTLPISGLSARAHGSVRPEPSRPTCLSNSIHVSEIACQAVSIRDPNT